MLKIYDEQTEAFARAAMQEFEDRMAAHLQRFFRDARVMEIIEGSSEVLEILIAEHVLADHRAAGGPESK